MTQAESCFYKAIEYSRANQWDDAIVEYLRVIEMDETIPAAHNNLASIYQRQNNYQQALIHFVKATHLQPDCIEFHKNVANLLMRLQKTREAIRVLNNIILIDPTNVFAHSQLGNLYLQQDDLTRAQKHFEMVLADDPDNIDILNNMGVLQLKNGFAQAAIDYFTHAYALDNSRYDIQSNIAATFMHHDRFSQALAHYENYIEHEPDDLDAKYNMGVAYMTLCENEKALKMFDEILVINANHIASMINVGSIYLREKQIENAKNVFEKVLKIDPHNESVAFMLATINGEESHIVPQEYIRNLFDYYAPQYDKHMKETLQYHVPEEIQKAIEALPNMSPSSLRISDLGCGTGFLGEILRPYAMELVGVDLSSKMLALASNKKHYDELLCMDIHSYLETKNQELNMIICADVFSYLDNLPRTISALARAIMTNGWCIFTIESSWDTKESRLQSSGRYVFNPDFVQGLLLEHGLTLCSQKIFTARYEDNRAVESVLFVAQCSRSTARGLPRSSIAT